MTDDQGYGVSGTFGGVIPTPTLDALAADGLRYTQFNSTALCSPTRAALITGRNHHSGGFGVITELSTGFPGYDSIIGPEDATIGRILKDNGYATSWFGKNHNTPDFQYTVAGPFDQWPSGMGFDYFYGFMGGETDQWTPYLFENNRQIFPVGRPGGRIQPHHRHGRQGDRLPAGHEGVRARFAVVPLLRARRHAFAAQPDEGVGREVQRQVRHGLERHARRDLRQPEAARGDPRKRQADRVARRPADSGTACRRIRRSSSRARPRSSPPMPPIPTTRSAASSSRSRTWASSTTR